MYLQTIKVINNNSGIDYLFIYLGISDVSKSYHLVCVYPCINHDSRFKIKIKVEAKLLLCLVCIV